MDLKRSSMERKEYANRTSMESSAQRRLTQLQDAIQQIQSIMKQLQRNVCEVKTDIQSDVSRSLDALRSREIWLMNQADLIQQAKQDILRDQEDQLNQALGSLTAYLTLLESGAEIPDDLLACLDLASLFGDVDDHPPTSPFLTFQSDTASFRRALLEYGRVETSNVPLSTRRAFASPESNSASLPKQFEDYEDDQQQVMYKSIRSDEQGNNIVFNLPKLTMKRSWNCVENETSASDESKPVSDRSTLPASVFTPVGGGVTDRKLSDASIRQWLMELKTDAPIEDDPTMHQDANEFSSTAIPSYPAFAAYYRKICSLPLHFWLSPESRVSAGDQCPAVSQLVASTQRMALEDNYWLAQQTDSSQCGLLLTKDHPILSRYLYQQEERKISEMLAHLPKTASFPYISYQRNSSEDLSDWLSKETDTFNFVTEFMKWVAITNSQNDDDDDPPKSKLFKSDDHCRFFASYAKKINSQPIDHWLAHPATEVEPCEVESPQVSYQRSPCFETGGWLASQEKEDFNTTEVSPENTWLAKPDDIHETETTSVSSPFPLRSVDDDDGWLVVDGNRWQPCSKSRILDNHMRKLSALPTTHWLAGDSTVPGDDDGVTHWLAGDSTVPGADDGVSHWLAGNSTVPGDDDGVVMATGDIHCAFNPLSANGTLRIASY